MIQYDQQWRVTVIGGQDSSKNALLQRIDTLYEKANKGSPSLTILDNKKR